MPPRRAIRKLVLVSDLHCGSIAGLLPRNAKTLHGNRIHHNAAQAWLADRWDEAMRFVQDSCKDDPFAVVVVGDVVEGKHLTTRKRSTR